MTAETPPTSWPDIRRPHGNERGGNERGENGDGPAVLDLCTSRSAVPAGARVSVAWATRNASWVRIAGPDGFGIDLDASAGQGVAEVVVHDTGEITAVAHGHDGRWSAAARPVVVVEPPEVLEFPEIDLSTIFVPSYHRLAIPLVDRTRQSGALLGAARPDAVRAQLGASVHRWEPADRVRAGTPPPFLFTVSPARTTWRTRNADPGPVPHHPGRVRALVSMFSTFVGEVLRRERRTRGSGKP